MKETAFALMIKGMKQTKEVFKGDRPLFFKYLTHMVATILSLCTILLYPIFLLSEVNLFKMVGETKKFNVEKSFEYSDKSKKYLTMLMYGMVRLLTVAAGFAVLALILYVCSLLAKSVDSLMTYKVPYIFMTFTWLSYTILGIYLIAQSLRSAPTAYIIATEDINMTSALDKGMSMMKTGGKFKLLFIRVVSLIKVALLVGIFVGIGFLVDKYFVDQVLYVVIAVGTYVTLLRLPKIYLSNKFAEMNLYQMLVKKYDARMNQTEADIMEEQTNQAYETLEALFLNYEKDTTLS